MNEISKERFVENVLWKFLERFAARGISLIVSIILARLLSADDYGLIALTTVFTNLSEILIDAGFSVALIQKKEVDKDDYACVFTISLIISGCLYFLLFLSASFISTYYAKPELTSVLRVMGLVLFIQAFASTRNAYVNRNMQFKLLMKCNTLAAVISGLIGIIVALFGLGVWVLVIQRLLQQIIITVLLFKKIKWRPKILFDKRKAKDLFGFSAGVIGASFINYIENCVNSLVIGKHYSISDLGYLDKATLIPEQISLNSFGAMTNVLLPTVASYQNDIEKLLMVIRKVVRYTTFLLFPIMIGVLVVSREVVIILFTEKWLPSVPLMKSICIYYIATPLMLIDIQVFFGLGNSRIRFKTEIVRLMFILFGVFLCCFVFKLDIRYIAMSNAFAVCLGTLVTHVEVKKLIGYTIVDRLKDSYKAILSTIVMTFLVVMSSVFFKRYIQSTFAIMIIKIFVGVVTYVLSSIFLKNKVFYEILGFIRKKKM